MSHRRTITVPASSFVDAVLSELSEVDPITTWELADDFASKLGPDLSPGTQFRKTAHTLGSLRRLGFVRSIGVYDGGRLSVGWMVSPTARWRNAETGEARLSKGDDVEWTVEASA